MRRLHVEVHDDRPTLIDRRRRDADIVDHVVEHAAGIASDLDGVPRSRELQTRAGLEIADNERARKQNLVGRRDQRLGEFVQAIGRASGVVLVVDELTLNELALQAELVLELAVRLQGGRVDAAGVVVRFFLPPFTHRMHRGADVGLVRTSACLDRVLTNRGPVGLVILVRTGSDRSSQNTLVLRCPLDRLSDQPIVQTGLLLQRVTVRGLTGVALLLAVRHLNQRLATSTTVEVRLRLMGVLDLLGAEAGHETSSIRYSKTCLSGTHSIHWLPRC